MDTELFNQLPKYDLQLLEIDDSELQNKFTQYVEIECVKQITHPLMAVKTDSKSKKKPIEFGSENCQIDCDYFREKIIEFISIKEFQTVFGVKKTAEIMNGITENKWNKSLILLYSFLFDMSFVYLKKDVVFDASKVYTKKVSI